MTKYVFDASTRKMVAVEEEVVTPAPVVAPAPKSEEIPVVASVQKPVEETVSKNDASYYTVKTKR